MSEKQPEALRLAAEVDEVAQTYPDMAEVSNMLRTQHADIERKDALLRQALEALYEAQAYTGSTSWSPSMTAALVALCVRLNGELAK